MSSSASHHHAELCATIRDLRAAFPGASSRELDRERTYPEALVAALTRGGSLAALVPEESGVSGLGVTQASVILEEINRAGGNARACHDIERKCRETRHHPVAPVSTHLILAYVAEHVLGLPRSF